MTRKEIVQNQIKHFEDLLKPLKDELTSIYNAEAEEVDRRISLARRGMGDFTLDELRFSATARCECGAGFAYPVNISFYAGAWECSAILMGKADRNVLHSGCMPFASHEVRSESQSILGNITTRPIKEN